MTAPKIQKVFVDALAATGWQLWLTACSNTPYAQRVKRWMRDIKRGHFVMEITSCRAPIDRIGELLSITRCDEYTIRTVDGRPIHWHNSEFIRIPRDVRDNHELFLLNGLSTEHV